MLLKVDAVRKYFGPEPVLDRVSFEIRPGERVALVGPNGTGKSTLMKIIAGMLDADGGTVESPDGTAIAYLEQHPDFEPGQTLWQVASSGMSHLIELGQESERLAGEIAEATSDAEREKLSARFDKIQLQLQHHDAYHVDHHIERVLQGLGFAESAYQQPIETLSGGQQNRVLLAKLLLSGADLLLLDEPSNHLDINATEWLESFLLDSSQAVLVVSHDRYFLDKVTTRTLELFHGTVDSYPGNFTKYWKLKAERLEIQTKTYEKQQEEIAKAEDFIRRNHYGQKSAQAKDREKKLARIERVDLPKKIEAPTMGLPPVERAGDLVLRVTSLSKGYDQLLFEDLTFDIERGQRWGILGPNGSGKTTLLKCIVGQEEPNAGKITLGTGVKVGYYDQMLSGLPPDAPMLEAVRPPGKEYNEQQRRDLLARFGLAGDIVEQPISSLSGGERSRTALARLAATDANFLILDEPTNHLDLWARDALERSLQKYEGTVLFVSHDRYFLNRVADHLLVVEPNRFRVIDGSYDTYVHLLKQGLAADAHQAEKSSKESKPKSSNKATNNKPTRRRKFPYRKVADLEDDIFQRESKIEQLHQNLTEPDVLRDGERVRAIQSEIQELQESLAALYEHWEEAVELN